MTSKNFKYQRGYNPYANNYLIRFDIRRGGFFI